MSLYDAKVALLGGVIDYAGTFPPAALPLADALKTVAGFRSRAKHPWLVGKVALPVSDLKKLNSRALYEAGSEGSAWLFAALGSFVPTSPATDYLSQVEWDLRELRRWQDRGWDSSIRLGVIAYETKLPESSLFNVTDESLYPLLGSVLDRLSSLGGLTLTPYFEVPLDGEAKPLLKAVAGAISQWVEKNPERKMVPGIKIRTGGQKVPSSEKIAQTIDACTSFGLKFKATQGLHHAVTGKEGTGFVNLFAALTFSQVLGGEGFGVEQVRACLDASKPSEFRFSGDEFSWKTHSVNSEKIEASRKLHAGCFGSCSADEPDADLFKVFG